MAEVGAVFVLQHCRGPSIAPELMIPDAADRAIASASVLNGACAKRFLFETTPEHILLLLERVRGSHREQTPDWMIAAFLRAPKHEHSLVSLN